MKRKGKKITFLIIGLCLIMVVGLIVFKRFIAPSEAVIINTDKEPESHIEPITNLSVSGNYVKFAYPAGFGKAEQTTPDMNRSLEQFSLVRSLKPGFEKIVVNVFGLDAGGLEEESSFAYRKNNPDTYLEGSEKYGDLIFTVFTKKDSSEITAYQLNTNKVATIALTTNSNKLKQLKDIILKSFTWVD